MIKTVNLAGHLHSEIYDFANWNHISHLAQLLIEADFITATRVIARNTALYNSLPLGQTLIEMLGLMKDREDIPDRLCHSAELTQVSQLTHYQRLFKRGE